MKKNKTLSFKITEDLKQKIDVCAKKEKRSVSNFVQLVLEREVKKRKK